MEDDKEGANWGVILLIALAVSLFLLFLGLILGALYSANKATSDSDNVVNILPCYQTVNTNDIINITLGSPPCIQQGVNSSMYYIGKLDTQQFNYVVAPWQTQPLDVCINFCTSYDSTTNICTGADYQGRSAQQNFDDCMTQLTPVNCSGAIPIAIRQNILYYAFSPTCLLCDGCE